MSLKKIRLLVVSPFPDGPEYIAGTIAKQAKLGHEVYVLCLSHGEMSSTDCPLDEFKKIRAEEQRAAASIEGVKEVFFSHLSDLKVFDTWETRTAIMDAIRKLKPDVLLTFWYDDAGNPDVRATGHAVIAACFMASIPAIKSNHDAHTVKKLLMFESTFSKNFEPSFYIDISDVIEIKKKAIMQHKSLARAFFGGDLTKMVESVLAADRYRGTIAGVKYAEAFKECIFPHGPKVALDSLPI